MTNILVFISQVTALALQVADAKKKAEEEAENALALEEHRKKLSKDVEALHRQIDELQQANDKLDKSESHAFTSQRMVSM